MPSVKQFYQSESKYLKASDFEKGKKFKFTITGNGVVEFDNNGVKKKKITLEFSQTKKQIALNPTNAIKISYLYGDEVDKWIGKDIFLYSGTVTYGDKMVDSVQVEMPLEEGTIQEGVSIKENTPAEDFQAPSATQDFQAPQAGQVGRLRGKNPPSDYDQFDEDIPF